MRFFRKLIFLFAGLMLICVSSLFGQNRSLIFNGTNNKVVISNDTDFDFTTEFTLEAWIYAEQWKSQVWMGSVINKDAELMGLTSGYMMRIGGGGRMEGIVTPGWVGTMTAPIMEEKTWNHVAMVFKQGEMWLYINGTLEAYKGGLPVSVSKSVANLQIGDSPGFPGRVWDGRIDEVRIWNVERTASQIQQNMAVPLQGNEEGLVAYYDFNESNTSSVLTDRTANNHHGTLVNYGGNYTWTTGYELKQNDLAVTGIINPVNSPQWSNAERVQVAIKNVAFNSVTNFDIAFEYNGETYVDNITTTIDPWQTYTHKFNKFINLESVTEAVIKAYVIWEQDVDTTNNMLEVEIVKTNVISLMDAVRHDFGANGQSHSKTLILPEDNSDFGQLLLHISLNCPPGGCDPWDQPAHLFIKKDNIDYEIGRFMTPFGVACGPWTIDVSDFRSILRGTVELVSYIQVWGGNGWLVTLDLEYVETVTDAEYSMIIPLYEKDRQVYGDPAISYDLPEQTVELPANTQNAHIRMTNTGHGQGNTNNAAEFMETYHHVWINGNETFTHHLWKDDCNQNPCSPQNGTWLYARAGWCPGQQVNPVFFDLNDLFTPGEEITIDYVLQDYTNFLNTGYNGTSHTEPYYRIFSYLYMDSDAPFADYLDLAINNISILDGSGSQTKIVHFDLENLGSLQIGEAQIGFVINNEATMMELVSLNLLPGHTTSFEFEVADFTNNQFGQLVGFADAANDKNQRNNVKGINFGYTSVSDNERYNLKIYPNPAKDAFTVFMPDNAFTHIEIFNIHGQLLYQNDFSGSININHVDRFGSGMLFLKLFNENASYFGKVLIK